MRTRILSLPFVFLFSAAAFAAPDNVQTNAVGDADAAAPGNVQTNASRKASRAVKPVAPEDSLILAFQNASDTLHDPDTPAKAMQGRWQDKPDPIASPEALPGGSITYAASSPPKSLNPYLDNNTFTYQVFGSLFESLLVTDPLTADYAPGIAQRWEISPDKLQFTFYIDPQAKWSDGRPITAEDVKWTFDAITATNSQTGPHKVALRRFVDTPPVIIDPLTIRFTSNTNHWHSLGAIGGMDILPAHIFRDKDFNKINSDFPVVSGPYRIEEIQEGISLTLRRREDWWARSRASTRNTFNFDRVVYRFFGDQDNAFDAFLAGEVDVYPVYRAAIWAERTSGQKFDSNWIVKRRIRNHHPIGFQGFAMNMRRPPFDDLRVRQALAFLLNRQRMVETLMHNQYSLHRSYFESLYDAEHPCTNPVFDFNPERAAALLDEAGWKPDPRTGLRMKDGAPLSFTFLTRDESSDKFLALYGEDLRKAGVEMKIEREDWAAWTRDMDEYNFDMTWAAWSAGLEPDPESMWSSAEADRPGGNNITGFKDKMVDELIETQKGIFNLPERNDICRRIDAILTEHVPYVLLWNIDCVRLLSWDKFGTPATVLSKFGDERSLLAYWWYDDDSADDLEDARANGDVLPPRPDVVDFDRTFAPSRAQ
jgi:microcin C transport system substrate-binding protein